MGFSERELLRSQKMGFYIGEHLIPYYGFMIVVGITAAAIVAVALILVLIRLFQAA